MKQWLDAAIERGAVPVITGQNGDMDTIGSAIALASIHPSLLACGLHLGRIAKRLVEDMEAPFRKVTAIGTAFPPNLGGIIVCLLYTSPSPRDYPGSRMPSSA